MAVDEVLMTGITRDVSCGMLQIEENKKMADGI